MASQAALVGYEDGFRGILHVACRDEVMWRVAIRAAKCLVDHLGVDARLHCLRDPGKPALFVTINAVAHLAAGASVRKLVEPCRVAEGAIERAVLGLLEPRWIDRDVARLMAFQAGGLLPACLSHTIRHRPHHRREHEHDRANDHRGGAELQEGTAADATTHLALIDGLKAFGGSGEPAKHEVTTYWFPYTSLGERKPALYCVGGVSV
jgi:hypothetical protein